MKKRVLTLIFALLICLSSMFTGCKSKEVTVDLKYNQEIYKTIITSTDDIKCDYLLQYPNNAHYTEIDAYMEFLNNLNADLSASFQLAPDNLPVDNEKQKIIYLGANTNNLSKENYSLLTNVRKSNYYDFSISSENNKMSICWVSKFGRDSAFQYVINEIGDSLGKKIADDFSILYLSENKEIPPLTINDIDINDYVIIVPLAISYMEMQGVTEMASMIKEITGEEIKIYDETVTFQKTVVDGVAKYEVYDKYAEGAVQLAEEDIIYEYPLEILIGNTNRAESYYTDFFSTNRYAFVQYSRKFIIRGGHTYSTAACIDHINDRIRKTLITAEPYSIACDYWEVGDIGSSDKPLSNGYSLVYSDEFDGATLNPEWIVNDDYQFSYVNGKDPTVYTYDKELASINNGKLCLETTPGELSYTGGQVSTNQTIGFKYGYFEVKANFKAVNGLWSRIGLSSRDYYGNWVAEVGFLNSVYSPDTVFGTAGSILNSDYDTMFRYLYERDYQHLKSYNTPLGRDFNDGRDHIFGLEWTDQYLKFYCDGIMYGSIDITGGNFKNFHEELYLLIGTGINLTSEKVDDEAAQWPNKFEIDWIHVYQKKGVGSITHKTVEIAE